MRDKDNWTAKKREKLYLLLKDYRFKFIKQLFLNNSLFSRADIICNNDAVVICTNYFVSQWLLLCKFANLS